MKRVLRFIMMLALALFIGFGTGSQARAAVVVPASGDIYGPTDGRAVLAALEQYNHIILQSGKTYYLDRTIWAKSNQSITATGARIISTTSLVRNRPTKTNYQSIQNFQINGGTWLFDSPIGYTKTMMHFAHANNIKIRNATIYCNYEGHSIELVACKNVTIDNCKLYALGKVNAKSHEEQIQIDVATKKTAPTVADAGKKYVQGQTCQNITVSKCKIVGSRGIVVNYENSYKTKFHRNVVLKNNVITGKSAEAVSLFNVVGATVSGNTMISECKKYTNAYSVGCHLAMFGKAPSSMAKATFKFTNNTIKGGRQALFTYAHCSSKFGKIIATGNKCYAKKGKKVALVIHKKSYKKKTEKKNKTYKW